MTWSGQSTMMIKVGGAGWGGGRALSQDLCHRKMSLDVAFAHTKTDSHSKTLNKGRKRTTDATNI